MPLHPLSQMAQKMLHARSAASPTSKMQKVSSAPPMNDMAAMPNLKAPKLPALNKSIGSSVVPDGTIAPKSKRSTKAARSPQADSAADSASDALAPTAFADGGSVDMDSAGASSGFKGPKSRSVRGAPSAPKQALQSADDGGELPQEVKPPPFTKGQSASQGAPAEAGEDPFAQLSRDMPTGDGTGPSPFAEAAPAAEAGLPGAAALMKRWGPVGALAGVPALMKTGSEAAEQHLANADKSDMEDAANYQGNATSQQLRAQKFLNGQQGGNDPGAVNAMIQHGSDPDKAIAQAFMQHLKKNRAGPQ